MRPSDLVRIDKNPLQVLAKRHPRIELGLIDLYRLRPAGEAKEYLRMVRRTNRHKLRMRIRMRVRSADSGIPALSLMSYSRDMSVGGICAVVDPADAPAARGLQGVLNTKVSVALPRGTVALTVSGTVVWARPAMLRGRRTIAMGVQFDEMSPRLSGMFMAFAGIAAKNRM